MISLFIDTSLSDVSIALVKDNKIISEIKNSIPGEHSVYVTKYIDDVLKECYLEPSFDDAKAYDSYQFVRHGFFCVDAKDSKPDALVFNRIVSLKSSFKLPK